MATTKKGGEISVSGRIRLGVDGKSRTVTTAGKDKNFTNTAVYEKQ